MQNQIVPRPVSSTSKLLPFLRSAALPVLGLPQTWRSKEPLPSRPQLVATPALLPRLSPAAALAHDARNALTSLHLLSGLLGEPGVLPATHANFAADLGSVTTSLSGLIEKLAAGASRGELLDEHAAPVAKAKAKATETASGKKQAGSAGAALASCTRLLATIAGSRVQVYVSAESGLPALAMDDDSLLRVLVNLVKNASEAMPDGGAVRITARRALSRTAPAVLLHVSDDGPGIAPLALTHIFEPGFTSKRPAYPGDVAEACGLGLAIVKELVHASGGVIQVASTRRRGTTFELRLPAAS